MNAHIAIIGAGISGLTVARHLSDVASITVFEKSRGPGGRMATRRHGDHHFDTGAQFFTARSRRFRRFLQPFMQSGTVQAWEPKRLTADPGHRPYRRPWFEPHYVAAPGMNSLAKELAGGMQVHTDCAITDVHRSAQAWWLTDADGTRHGPFDGLVCTAPAPQTRQLLPDEHAQAWLDDIRFSSCLCLLVGLAQPAADQWDVLQPRHSPIRWMADNASRPERPENPSLVIHTRNDWSDAHFGEADEVLQGTLLDELRRLTGITGDSITHVDLKRWRLARVEQAADTPFWLDVHSRLGICGDGAMGPSVESAFTSADRLATALRQVL